MVCSVTRTHAHLSQTESKSKNHSLWRVIADWGFRAQILPEGDFKWEADSTQNICVDS